MKFGLYQHFKGPLYVAECVALDSENQEEIVIYWSLKSGPTKKFARAKEMFLEEVKWPDGIKRPRFLYQEIV